MKTFIIEAYELLRGSGLVSNESEFSEEWLGHSECYLRTLRFKNAEPSRGSIAVLASRLQRAGEQMIPTGRYRQLGLRFIDMSEKCHASVNEDAVALDLAD